MTTSSQDHLLVITCFERDLCVSTLLSNSINLSAHPSQLLTLSLNFASPILLLVATSTLRASQTRPKSKMLTSAFVTPVSTLNSSRAAFTRQTSFLSPALLRSPRSTRVRPPCMTAATSAVTSSQAPLIDLRGKKALVTGIANNRSIAWGIAQQLHAAGAEIGVTYLPLNEKVQGKVRSLTESLEPSLFQPCDVTKPEEIAALTDHIEKNWGGIDIFVHCLAFADRKDLEGKFSATEKNGFNMALDISAFSLVEMTGKLKPLFNEGASVITLSYLGAEKVIPNYNVMGVAKAALEATVRYLAAEMGPDGIRVNAISAGPIRTLASSAIGGISSMIKHVETIAPLRRTVTQVEVGNAAAFLLSRAASGITGQVVYVDAGYNIIGAPHTV